jgi:tetratricopeptide (TPR) repeat protein
VPRGAGPRRPTAAPNKAGRGSPRVEYVDFPQLQSASEAWRQGDHQRALELFELAVRERPHSALALVKAARAYADKYRVDRAEVLLDRLCHLAPSHPGVHHLAGDVYSGLQLPEKAIACYERACECQGAGPPTWVDLATLLERSHRVDEASELIERALKAMPRMPAALLVRARVERRQGAWDRAEGTLRNLLEQVPAETPMACRAWADLAWLFDRQEQYDAAMEAIERCKQAQLRRDAAEWRASEHVLNRFRHMIETITRADFGRWHQQREDLPPLRVALLTGFPRSGTTLLEQVLDAHPDLVSSEERDFVARELFPTLGHGLANDAPVQDVLDRASPARLLVERRRYLDAMQWMLGQPIGDRVHLDKNPAYNLVLPIMLRIFPETRLIVALRDPRDVVISCYLRYLPLNPVSVRFLTLERTAQRYALDMQAWLKFRDMVQTPWCEVRYEDAVADLGKQARRMLDTLGLPWDPMVLDYRQRLRDRHVNSPTYEDVARPVYTTSVGRWRHYEQYLAPVLPTLEPFVEAVGY